MQRKRTLKVVNYSPGIQLKLIKNTEWNEYQILWIENGKVNNNKTYFTDSKEDAFQTLTAMLNHD